MGKSGRDFFSKYNKIINILINISKVFPRSFNKYLFKVSANFDSKLGALIRFILCSVLAKDCGTNVYIAPRVFIYHIENLSIGSNVSIHPMCYLDAEGDIRIGNNVSIAHSTSILSSNHTWDDQDLPIKYNPMKQEKVLIEDDVWIGCGVRVLSGVNIGSRSIIAAGAIVTKNTPSNVIVAGSPAKKIKDI
ncbi:acyltransferase [Bacteroides sp. 519]|uniref:acyltransferase n=1 Tax=Bacteroides sp. 519 TaxID=2302937 RepID=UPI0013D76BBB|nr:acyltransferase [Bacteroides sp. 519]NDV60294.1 acyltransferase [Bacteroides sp. 519]